MQVLFFLLEMRVGDTGEGKNQGHGKGTLPPTNPDLHIHRSSHSDEPLNTEQAN